MRTKWLGLKSLHSLNIWEVVFLRSTLIEISISLEMNESVSTTWMESYFCCLRGRAPCLDGLLFASGLYRVPAGWPSLHVRLCVFEEGETLHTCYFCSPQMIVGCSLGPYHVCQALGSTRRPTWLEGKVLLQSLSAFLRSSPLPLCE